MDLLVQLDKQRGQHGKECYYWEKLTFSNFHSLGKKIWRNALTLKNKKIQGIFRGTFILTLSSSAVFRLQNFLCLRFLLNCFVREIKGFYQSSPKYVSLNILAKNQNFKELRHGFVDEGAIIKTTLMSSCHRKSLVPLCLEKKRWKRTFNINSELSQNRTEKQIMPFKTTVNRLLNMWCYLVIAFLDWKIGVSQQQ